MKNRNFSKVIIIFGIFFFWSVGSVAAFTRDLQSTTDPYTLIAEVNALRISNGLQPYTTNSTLMAVAQAHSDYQASISTVTHYSSDGSRP